MIFWPPNILSLSRGNRAKVYCAWSSRNAVAVGCSRAAPFEQRGFVQMIAGRILASVIHANLLLPTA
jgi:hypothetical protein